MFHAERFSVRDQTLCSVWNIFHSVHCALRKLDRSNAPVRRRHVFHMESFPSAPSRSRSRRVFRVERSSVTKDQMYSTWNISFQPHDGHPQLYCSTIFDEAVRDSRRERWLCKSRHTFHPCKRRMFHMERFSFSYTIPGDCPSKFAGVRFTRKPSPRSTNLLRTGGATANHSRSTQRDICIIITAPINAEERRFQQPALSAARPCRSLKGERPDNVRVFQGRPGH